MTTTDTPRTIAESVESSVDAVTWYAGYDPRAPHHRVRPPTETPRADAEETHGNLLGKTLVPSEFALVLERELAEAKAEVERLKEERDKWRRAAEALSHKPRLQLDQRKFAKQDWWNKQLAND